MQNNPGANQGRKQFEIVLLFLLSMNTVLLKHIRLREWSLKEKRQNILEDVPNFEKRLLIKTTHDIYDESIYDEIRHNGFY